MGMVTPQISDRLQRLMQNTFLWGCVGMAAAIVLTAVAAMSHDIRWLLWIAWPFMSFAIWEFARTWLIDKEKILSITFLGILLSGLALAWLYNSLAPSDVQSPSPLAALTNTQLREKTIAFAQTLRDFETKFTNEDEAILQEEQSAFRPGESKEESRQRFFATAKKLLELDNKERNDFMNNYRTDALILRDELKKRLGELPYPSTTSGMGTGWYGEGDQIFEGPLLTGAYPITVGANLLEYWAAQLP